MEAAKGCGMSRLQTLLRVELPLAMPTIIAGLRMAAIYTVSWAVLASMIGLGGLGRLCLPGHLLQQQHAHPAGRHPGGASGHSLWRAD
ncbi:MAG: ABC transporter permease subunit [Oscillospiraceae bacterium]